MMPGVMGQILNHNWKDTPEISQWVKCQIRLHLIPS